MSGLLFLLIIILYAEISLCPVTRSISRVIFYTHVLALITPMYATTPDQGIIQAGVIYLFGFIYCSEFSNTIRGKVVFIALALLTSYFYTSLYIKDLSDIMIFGIVISEHSATIFRWSILFALGSCSYLVEKDYKFQLRDVQLAIGTTFLMCAFP